MYVDNFLLTNLQNFKQKDLTEVKICEKVIGGGATLFKNTTYSIGDWTVYRKLQSVEHSPG